MAGLEPCGGGLTLGAGGANLSLGAGGSGRPRVPFLTVADIIASLDFTIIKHAVTILIDAKFNRFSALKALSAKAERYRDSDTLWRPSPPVAP